jgi:HPt (histidine-containing phosphotransfer) domain-containing protein
MTKKPSQKLYKSMIVDWSRIEVLADPDDPDDMEWLKETVRDLAVDIDKRLTEISDFVQKNENENLKATIHQLKGVASNFGLMQVFDICVLAEALLKEEKTQDGYEETKKLPDTWASTRIELRKKFPV